MGSAPRAQARRPPANFTAHAHPLHWHLVQPRAVAVIRQLAHHRALVLRVVERLADLRHEADDAPLVRLQSRAWSSPVVLSARAKKPNVFVARDKFKVTGRSVPASSSRLQ